MKNPKLRSYLLIGLMFIVSFIAAWLSVSRVRAWSEKRSNPSLAELLAQGGVSDIRVAPEPDLSQFPAERLAQWWDRPVAGPDDPVEVMVELEDAPAIEAYLQAQPDGASFDKQSVPQAVEASQAQLARVERAQQRLAAALTGSEFNARITGQVQRVFNGVGVQVAAGRLREIRRLPGVKAVHILKPMYLTTETSVPFIGAPQVWQGGSGIPGATGEGVKVALLDTGIDYIHVNFGGSGSTADYAANNPTVIGDVSGFPGVKIVGGHDFVGNAYNAASSDPNLRIPRPDPDPMDCYGHGTGTASIVAGFGVISSGATYTGPYNLTTHSNQFRVGPGVAPKATLYSYKVYGCDPRGGTNGAVVAQAIDRALDPNGDGDFADRVNVILLPFSGSFGVLPGAPEVVAIDRAAQLNVLSVGSAGNGGDTYYAVGSPGAAPKAISVANANDNGFFFQNIQVTSPSNIAGNYPAAVSAIGPSLGAEITGNLVNASPNDGCAPLTNADAIIDKVVVVANTGNCTRTNKVRNAQNAGAIAVVIANNVDTLPPTLLDDGTGSDIRIPSLLLNMAAGVSIQNTLASNTPVTIRFTPSNTARQPEQAKVLAPSCSRGGLYFSSSRVPINLKPDITAPGVNIGVARVGTGNGAGFFTGTSMAAPHVAGVAALASQRGVDADEFVDALFGLGSPVLTDANGAPPGAGPARVGSGFVHVPVFSGVIRLEDTATFRPLFESVRNQFSNVSPFQIRNTGVSATTVNVTFTQTSDVPGVDLSFLGAVTVPAGGKLSFNLGIAYTPSAMKHTRDNTVSATQSGQPRHWVSEESGYFNFTPQGGGDPLRVPILFSSRPASEMTTTQTSLNLSSATGAFNLNLTGQQVHTGNNFPTDEISIASPFELQEISPVFDFEFGNGSGTFVDLQHIGVRSNFPSAGSLANTIIGFGVSTYGDWQTPNEITFRIFIDTDRDGVDDFEAFNTSFPNEQGAPSDVFFVRLRNLKTGAVTSELFLNSVTAAQYNTQLFNTNVMVLPVRASSLGLNPTNARFNYRVVSGFGTGVNFISLDSSRRLSYDPTKPGPSFGANSISFDLNGGTIPVNYNLNDFRANGSEGVLLLHHHNTEGNRAQVLPANLGFEGDVAPRPGGNGSTTIADWTQVGRFVAGLDEVNLGNEFQRADCAPRSSGGNGQLTVADWVQAGRYAAGLDPVASATGPYLPIILRQFVTGTGGEHEVAADQQGRWRSRISEAQIRIPPRTNRTVSVAVELDAQGGENGFSFSLNFDPAALSNPQARLGRDVAGAILHANANEAAQGRFGVALVLPAGRALAAGKRQIVVVTFTAVGAADLPIRFGDRPVASEVIDLYANALPAAALRLADALTESPTARDRMKVH